jgi:hypothetical protein
VHTKYYHLSVWETNKRQYFIFTSTFHLFLLHVHGLNYKAALPWCILTFQNVFLILLWMTLNIVYFVSYLTNKQSFFHWPDITLSWESTLDPNSNPVLPVPLSKVCLIKGLVMSLGSAHHEQKVEYHQILVSKQVLCGFGMFRVRWLICIGAQNFSMYDCPPSWGAIWTDRPPGRRVNLIFWISYR